MMMGQGYSDPIDRMSRTGSADPPDNNPYVPIPSASQETSTTVLADALPEIEVSLTNPNHYGLKVGSKKQQHLDGDSDHGSSNLALIDESSHDKQLIKMDQPQLMMVTKKGWTQLFGAEMPPDIIAIAMVYFVQGILNLPMLAMNYFLKDNLHLDPAEVATLLGFSNSPWLIKPLYGFISDGVPLFGYRRRSYLVLCGLVGAVSWVALATVVDSQYSATAMILLGALSVAFSDVVVDSMVVERARGESQGTSGSLQSLCWGSCAVGRIVSAYFSGYFVENLGVRFVFGVTALFPLITSGVAGLVDEEPWSPRSRRISLLHPAESADPDETRGLISFLKTSKIQLDSLWETIKEPNILMPTIFLFLFQATPTSEKAMFFFLTNKLGFQPEFMGRVQLVVAFANLAGVALYNTYLKHVSLKKMFFWTTILGMVLGLTQLLLVTGTNRTLGMSDEWFCAGDSLVLTVIAQVAFMPIMVLAAKLCPPGVEATLFATLMSISNGAGIAGEFLGAGLMKVLGVTGDSFDNLPLLLVICYVSTLLLLPFLLLLPSETTMDDDGDT
ncbi:unnamed protein product [Sphagnum troendelagicum]|uniref:Biopterin transport-related protein BT1 n=1 Tax=Sphagnum troendelagicum TaxID=128251 RepID=A0ABP0TW94_9BRYO